MKSRAFLAGWWMACLILHPSPGQTQSARLPPNRQKAPVAAPFTLERILGRLQEVAKKEYPEAALIRKIEKDGIDFVSTPQNLSRLTDAGASASLLELVKHLAPVPAPPPPPIPKPDPTGTVQVTCAPAECLIALGGKGGTATSGGKLIRRGVAPGEVPIDISKEGFLPFSGAVKIIPNGTSFVTVELKPSLSKKQEWGTQLKDKAEQALGGESGLKQTRSVLSSGEATIWGRNGNKYASSLEMLLRIPDKAFFRARAGKASTYEVEFLPTFRAKSNLPEQEARDLEAGLRLLRKYQIAAVFERISQPWIRLIADSDNPRDGAEFRAKSSAEDLIIVLDSNRRPKEVREDLPFGEGIRALYSAYQSRDNAYFPTRISILWPGSPKQGISVQFQNFEFNPDRKKDGGYRLKKAGGVFSLTR
ncbi:MAG: hypothetical protein M3Z09_01920 [Acidobacteriota bacterium]|nr:hypothetical protein [Acidobacteriota bacterium]